MVSNKISDLTHNKYNRLLSSLILMLVFSSLTRQDGSIRFLLILISLSTLFQVLRQLKPGKFFVYIYCFLISVLLCLWGIEQFRDVSFATSLQVMGALTFLFILGIPVYFIQKDLTSAEHVTSDVIKGGVAVYVLFGVAWATLYSVLFNLDPRSFAGISSEHVGPDLLYFSLTTLTTVGYGDINPTDPISRILANLEGLFGVMYPTIFIAILVSLYQGDAKKSS